MVRREKTRRSRDFFVFFFIPITCPITIPADSLPAQWWWCDGFAPSQNGNGDALDESLTGVPADDE